MKLVSFVIPCYRSENTISSVAEEIRSAMEALPGYEYEMVLVNDCSPDSTFSVIEGLARADHRITAVDLAKNFGQHAAIMAGLRRCSGDYVVCLDDDWTVVTEDGSLSAHYENTVLITDGEPEILSLAK